MKLSLIQGTSPVAYVYKPDNGALVLECRDVALRADQYLLLELVAEQHTPVHVIWSFFTSEDEDDLPTLTLRQSVMPLLRVYAGFTLGILGGERVPPLPGQFALQIPRNTIDPDAVCRVRVSFSASAGDLTRVIVYRLFVADELPDMTVFAEKPMLDALGQMTGFFWPGKARSHEELSERLRKERAQLLEYGEESVPYPPDYSRYGGHLPLRLTDGSGYFALVKHDGRSYFADPDGYAYLARGVGGEGCQGVFMHVDGMGGLCQTLPDPNDALFTQAYMLSGEVDEYHARYTGPHAQLERMMVNFTRIGLMHAFGDEWRAAFCDIHAALLRRTGVNAMDIGCMGQPDAHVDDFVARVRIPYTLTLPAFPHTEPSIYLDFPDVFSTDFRDQCNVFAARTDAFANDPLLIGYLIADAPGWQRGERPYLSRHLLKGSRELASRTQLMNHLKNVYHDSVSVLNVAWGTSFECFDDVCWPDHDLPQTVLDLIDGFDDCLLEEYARVPAQAIRERDDKHLLLGFRLSRPRQWLKPLLAPFDVQTYVCRAPTPNAMMEEAMQISDLPILIGGWQFGTRRHGLHGGTSCVLADAEARGFAMRQYIESGFSCPACVGMLYDSCFDLPPLGRFDGANGQIGLCDISMSPYTEALQAFNQASRCLYAVASGTRAPFIARVTFEPV